MTLPNGLVYTFGWRGPSTHRVGEVWYVTDIRDPFGNRVALTYFSQSEGPTDGIKAIRQYLGNGQVRTVTFTVDPTTRTLRTMTYQGRTWTYTHGPADVQGYRVLTQVRGPEAGFNTWTFGYGQPDYGSVMTSLTAPWGGRVTYAYARVPWYVKGIYRDSFMVVRRTVEQDHLNAGAHGTWTFQYAQGGNKDTTIVITPCGRLTYRFAGLGMDSSADYAGWRAGLLLERRTLGAGDAVLEQALFGWTPGERVSASAIPGIEPGVWASSSIQPPLLQHVRVIRGPESWLTTHEYHSSATDGNPQTFYNDFGHPWRTTARDLVSGQQRVKHADLHVWLHTVSHGPCRPGDGHHRIAIVIDDPPVRPGDRVCDPRERARPGHHIVEQTPGNLARFGPQAIHNTGNVVALDVGAHRQISGFYSSKQPFTNGQTVRQWLSGQSREQQRQFGLETLRRFGGAP